MNLLLPSTRQWSSVWLTCICLIGCGPRGTDDISRLMRIDQLIAKADFDQALQETNRYLQDYPQSFKGWNELGWIQLKTDQVDDSARSFDKSIEINPNWDNSHVGRGAVWRRMGNTDAARTAYLKAIQLNPDSAAAFSSLLVIELMGGNDLKLRIAFSRRGVDSVQRMRRLPGTIDFHHFDISVFNSPR